MIVLSALDKLYIRGLYYQPTLEVSISEIMLDTAEKGPIADAPQALEVENCQCPPNYRGSSCEVGILKPQKFYEWVKNIVCFLK